VTRVLSVLLATLALAGPAAASTPRFGLWDLQVDLAHASRNAYGDVAAKPRAALSGKGTLVRCGTWCRLGPGWLAFHAKPRLAAADVRAAQVVYSKRLGWTVRATLTRAGLVGWTAFEREAALRARQRGVPDVLVVAAGSDVAATPLVSAVAASHGELVVTGFSRASAKAFAAAIR
jgi:hypothetical protein